MVWAYGLTYVVYVFPALVWTAILPWPLALAAGMALAALTAQRFLRRMRGRRALWVTRLLDEPLAWHWSGSLLGLLLIAPLLGLGFLLHVAGLSEHWVRGSLLGAYGFGLVVSAWGTWPRRRLVALRRFELKLPGLAPEFDGYRIAQLSDLHVGNFDRLSTARRWVERANRLKPDLVVVTGDLVTSGTEFYADVAEALAHVRAPDGVVCILGNHDQWDDRSCRAALRARGIVVLENDQRTIERNGAKLVLAGLDDPYTGKADLNATLSGIPEQSPTILLSHYPEWFEPAAQRKVALVLSGHTHGGQLGVPFFGDRLNLAVLSRQRSRGLYRAGQTYLYVNAGLGTTGPPIRLGVPPEIALFTLECDESKSRSTEARQPLTNRPASAC